MKHRNFQFLPGNHEWVTLKSGNREIQAFVVYPQSQDKTKAVVVIHENRGFNDWRLFADKLAGEGYLVIAPDLISNTKEKRTSDFDSPDAARDALYDLDPAMPFTIKIFLRHMFLMAPPLMVLKPFPELKHLCLAIMVGMIIGSMQLLKEPKPNSYSF